MGEGHFARQATFFARPLQSQVQLQPPVGVGFNYEHRHSHECLDDELNDIGGKRNRRVYGEVNQLYTESEILPLSLYVVFLM